MEINLRKIEMIHFLVNCPILAHFGKKTKQIVIIAVEKNLMSFIDGVITDGVGVF